MAPMAANVPDPDEVMLHRRLHHDPAFLLRVRTVQQRLAYELRPALDDQHRFATLLAAKVVRDLFPDAEWIAEQERRAETVKRLMADGPLAKFPDV